MKRYSAYLMRLRKSIVKEKVVTQKKGNVWMQRQSTSKESFQWFLWARPRAGISESWP
jgi:hypothetical protein